ncbi:MAG: 3'(2'),5'-bisphosphate nucleotidase CysQ [Rhizobiaceae bacterium]
MPAINSDTLDILHQMAIEGGRIAMRYHGRLDGITLKEDDSPLTAADIAVDEFLHDELSRTFPDTPIVTEERSASQAVQASGRFFLVDPIDGTKEFVASRGEFTVNIGLIENGVPVAGAVCAPAVGRAFSGAAGIGAFESAMDGTKRRALVLAKPDNAALVAVASRSHLTPETDEFIRANHIGRLTNAGSSLKFCLLAGGEADIYPRFGPTMEWDTAAGDAVLRAAGGKVEKMSGDSLDYGKPGYRNPFFVAYTPGTLFNRQTS